MTSDLGERPDDGYFLKQWINDVFKVCLEQGCGPDKYTNEEDGSDIYVHKGVQFKLPTRGITVEDYETRLKEWLAQQHATT